MPHPQYGFSRFTDFHPDLLNVSLSEKRTKPRMQGGTRRSIMVWVAVALALSVLLHDCSGLGTDGRSTPGAHQELYDDDRQEANILNGIEPRQSPAAAKERAAAALGGTAQKPASTYAVKRWARLLLWCRTVATPLAYGLHKGPKQNSCAFRRHYIWS